MLEASWFVFLKLLHALKVVSVPRSTCQAGLTLRFRFQAQKSQRQSAEAGINKVPKSASAPPKLSLRTAMHCGAVHHAASQAALPSKKTE